MGHHVYPMVQSRCSQGVQNKTCFCWHGLEFSGPQRKDLKMEHVPGHNFSTCRLDEVFSGHWLGFSVRRGKPLNPSCTILNSLKEMTKDLG